MNSRSGRHWVTIHSADLESDRWADQVIRIRPDRDFECFWTLRALARGVALDSDHVAAATGVSLEVWRSLMERMKQATYAVILFDHALTAGPHGRACSHAMLSLVREMNGHARFVCLPLGAGGNGTGAENVLTAATGYPFAVSLARGYPRFGPGDYSGEGVLARGEADAALIVAAGDLSAGLGPSARQHLAKLPTIVIDHRGSALTGATIAFLTSKSGVHTSGTVYRSDGVPLPLRPALATTRPHAVSILRAIEARLRAKLGAQSVDAGAIS
jgi:formylmethanofuran dehydrogenase subunit B